MELLTIEVGLDHVQFGDVGRLFERASEACFFLLDTIRSMLKRARGGGLA